MENRTINLAAVAEVAAALGILNEDVVFVGGAVLSLYTDDPAADEIPPTQDIDLTLDIVSFHHWAELQQSLSKLGFYPDPSGHAICSYKYKDIAVDIMATEDGPFGPSNPWYKPGFENLWTVKIKDQIIKILSAPYYLATKFEAFKNRGNDYRTSHDIEDIIYVIDNRSCIVEEIKESEAKVFAYLKHELLHLKAQGHLKEVLMAHIHPLMIEDRLPLVEDKVNRIIGD